ncbi:MAG: hypothetical protein ACK53W_17025 [Gemmatimonadota bacterium]
MGDAVRAVGPTGTSPSSARRAERAHDFRATEEAASLAASLAESRATDATGFDLLFAALRDEPAASSTGALAPPTASARSVRSGSVSSAGARAVESASYAVRWDFMRGTGASSRTSPASRVTPASSARVTPASSARVTRAEADDAEEADEAASADAATRADDAAAHDEAVVPPAAVLPPAAVPPTPLAVVPPVATSSHDAALATVQPALRDRLERVIERMQREFGHDVRVVEGRRSQARQDALYAQGRTAPGPVVTWTRDSAHRDGAAVDVMINGGYDDAAAFRTLARIAAEEGLRTLGPRDPGHLEVATAPDAGPARGTAAMPSLVAVVARVASPAPVAAPTAASAAVASPAPVARVASLGGRPGAGNASRDRTSGLERERMEELAARLAPPLATGSTGEGTATVPVGQPRVDLTARLEAIARVRDAQAAQPLARLVMDVPDDLGGVDRIAVSLRGQRLDAALAIQDPATASRVADRVARLAEALGARGYEAGTLSVTTARGIAPESLDLVRLGAQALEREGTRGVASILQDVAGAGLRERHAAPGRQDDPSTPSREHDRRSGDTPRRQSRRDPGDR